MKDIKTEYADLSLLERIQKVKSSVIYIQQDKSVDLRYWVNSYDKVMERIRPLHIKYGICVVPQVIKASQRDMIDRKTGKHGGYLCEIETRFDVIAVPPIITSDTYTVVSAVVAASFNDLGGLATSKAFTHCHLKFLISFYEILTGSEEEERKVKAIEEKEESHPVSLISNEQIAELRRVGAMIGVEDDQIARAGNAIHILEILQDEYDPLIERLKKKAQQLGKWVESNDT